MSDTLCAIHIEYGYITLVRAAMGTGSVLNMEIAPLDTMVAHDKAVLEGLRDLKKSGSFIKGEPVHLSFQSAQTKIFQSALSPLVEDVHEAMSWELMARTDEPVENFSFVAFALEQNRAMAIAQPVKELKQYLSLLKKIGVKPVNVTNEIVALANLVEKNYDVSAHTIVCNIAADTSSVIYLRNGLLWDVKLFPGIDEAVEINEIVPKLKQAGEELAQLWGFSLENCATLITGAIASREDIKTSTIAAFPGSRVLSCFEKILNSTGNDTETISRYNPVVAVSVGVAISGVA